MAIEVIETQVFDSGEHDLPMAAKHKGYNGNVNNNSRFESMIRPIEADIPDPVSHSVHLGRWDKVFSWIMTFTVVPIKIICALFWLIVAWLVCLFFTKLMPDEGELPYTYDLCRHANSLLRIVWQRKSSTDYFLMPYCVGQALPKGKLIAKEEF